jgi:sugar phosphate permease
MPPTYFLTYIIPAALPILQASWDSTFRSKPQQYGFSTLNRAATDEATIEDEEREDHEGEEYAAKEKKREPLPQRVRDGRILWLLGRCQVDVCISSTKILKID